MSWCFEDEVDAYADAVLDRLAGQEALVPCIWPLEVMNVLVMGERWRRLTQAQSLRFQELLLGLPILVEPPPGRALWFGITSLAREHQLTAYDASYLELALRQGVPLATNDTGLLEALERCRAPRFLE